MPPAASPRSRRDRRWVHGLLIPARDQAPCTVLGVPLSASAISDLLGGGMLDDSCIGCHDGRGFTLYRIDSPPGRRCPLNPQAVTLARQLGCPPEVQAALGGDILALGLDLRGDDDDVPLVLLETAARLGITVSTTLPRDAAAGIRVAGPGGPRRPPVGRQRLPWA